MPVKAIDWQIQAHVRPYEAAIGQQKPRHACFVIGTTIGASEWGDTKVIAAYKRQSQVEGGFRFLKDLRFFVSSLVVNRPCCMVVTQFEIYRHSRASQNLVKSMTSMEHEFARTRKMSHYLLYPRALDGDDARLAGLLGGTTPIAPAISTPASDGAEPTQPTYHVANLTLGLPAIRRHSPGSVTAHGQVYDLIEGLNDLQIKALRLFGEEVCYLYSC